MHQLLKEKITERFERPVNTPKDCKLLSEDIYVQTKRTISSTTLRRFFGLLVGKSAISAYNLDTLAIYCGQKDYHNFFKLSGIVQVKKKQGYEAVKEEVNQITQYTLKSIIRKSLTKFSQTIPREDINNRLNAFLDSPYSVFTLIGPGGYGKSIALAHWVKSILNSNDHCLFCPASIFYHLLSDKTHSSQILNLQVRNPDNLFLQFFNEFSEEEKKLVIVVDALDEISTDSKKIYELFEYLFEILNRYNRHSVLKIVLSIREANWSHLMSSDIRDFPLNKYFLPDKGIVDSGYRNIPVLTNDEIRMVLENVNKTSVNPVIYNTISWELREMIKVPINLHFFISVFHKKPGFSYITRNVLNHEYLKQVIFLSKYAEEKEDLIWKIVELIENKKNDFYIQKNELKAFYPIHLKRETKYYSAYNDLLTNGILLVKREENKYGIFTTWLSFKHLNFYYYLSVLNLIRKNQGIDSGLFVSVSRSGKEIAWINYVTSILYEIAYENNDYEAIESFCELPEEILGSLEVRMSVGASFRNPVKIRERIVKKFAASPKGQLFFFEQYVDTNYLYNNFAFRIKEYLKHKQTVEAKLFGNAILFMSGFLKMNVEKCEKHFEVINNITPDKNIHPWPTGRKVTSHLFYSYFVKREKMANIGSFIRKYQNIAYQYKHYLDFGLTEFELSIMVALVVIQEFEVLIEMLEIALKAYNFDSPTLDLFAILSNNQNSLPVLFLEYAKFKQGKTYAGNLPLLLEKRINNYITIFEDFQYQIILKWFLCDYYLISGDMDNANKHYLSALELSQFAQYDFYTAFLMINNPEKDPEIIQQAEEKIKRSGCNPELLVYH